MGSTQLLPWSRESSQGWLPRRRRRNTITAFFFNLNKVNGGGSRPDNIDQRLVRKVGVIGAGMMGQGIAYVAAKAGVEVVLKDISIESAERGKRYSEIILDKAISRDRSTEEQKQSLLELITPTADDSDLEGCDLIVEAVFEDIQLKNAVTKASERRLNSGGVWASNTSSLPISELAQASSCPENFIGLHFFHQWTRCLLSKLFVVTRI